MRYNELSDEAKRKAVKWMQESNGEHFDGDFVIEEWKTLLDKLGFIAVDIRWRGFCSQGDGACFTASWSVDWLKLEEVLGYTSDERAKEITAYPEKVRGLYKLLSTVEDDEEQESPIVVGASLEHRGRHCHANSIKYAFDTGGAYPTADAEEEFKDYANSTKYAFDTGGAYPTADAEEEFKDWCRDLMHMIYKDLEAEYEWVTDEEYAVEAIDINDYNFNEEGEAT
jgi:hypothetical protein